MKTKILVCGSTDFLPTNFIRYLLYRSKDFEIVSIDNLDFIQDIKRIYINKNHRFYIGDMSDKYFMERIVALEKPDYIICSDEICDYQLLLKTTLNLIEFGIPVIMLLPVVSNNDPNQMCVPIKSLLINNGHTAIEMPNRFGMRQRPYVFGIGSNVAFIIKCYLYDKAVCVFDKPIPWVYAEDVASFIWFIIENKYTGLVSMPSLGLISEKEIAEKIESLYQKDYLISTKVDEGYIKSLVTKHETGNFHEWVPDSKDLDSVIEKTIRWFDANRWALSE